MNFATAVLALYASLSLITYLAYARDKKAAIRNNRRTPERTLHLLALLGGWPGAWLARESLRHKSAKTRFRVVFWLTTLVNLFALGLLVTMHLS